MSDSNYTPFDTGNDEGIAPEYDPAFTRPEGNSINAVMDDR